MNLLNSHERNFKLLNHLKFQKFFMSMKGISTKFGRSAAMVELGADILKKSLGELLTDVTQA